MGVGEKIETRGHVLGFKEEIGKAVSAGKDTFFGWFNSAADADAGFVRGSWDFAFHMANPAAPYISCPESKTAVEIGYGGGRLIAAASRHFKAAVGVDIHGQSETVAAELKRRGIANVTLLQSDGRSIPLENGSVDFVYSFIVLQHVEKIAVFERYVEEAGRILKSGGMAVLYFGRRAVYSSGTDSRLRYLVDRFMEMLVLRGGYSEIPAVVNDVNLYVSISYAADVARRAGFRVRGVLISRKNVPDGVTRYGGQHGLILEKV